MSLADNIRHQLALSRQWQAEIADAGLQSHVTALENWQKNRLRLTYGDFAQRTTHQEATEFFVAELYAPDNLARRNAQMAKMLPLMFKLLPPGVLATVEQALSAQSDAQAMDFKMARQLRLDNVSIASMGVLDYASAYRAAATEQERAQQIEQIVQVGHSLEHMVNLPMIYRTLKMARWPAKMAGLSDLQQFLEQGFHAFNEMGGADEFLAAIQARESQVAKILRTPATEPPDLSWSQLAG